MKLRVVLEPSEEGGYAAAVCQHVGADRQIGASIGIALAAAPKKAITVDIAPGIVYSVEMCLKKRLPDLAAAAQCEGRTPAETGGLRLR